MSSGRFARESYDSVILSLLLTKDLPEYFVLTAGYWLWPGIVKEPGHAIEDCDIAGDLSPKKAQDDTV
ncbi:MAG: hypothetical protein DMG62_15365 [Acidobacteria bacterium]|nr:MAG: hypothetical protein DMG62_15365 [Acidobacteriota bacterium]